MDSIVQSFLTWQFIFFCLGISSVILVIRRFIDFYLKPTNKHYLFWEELVMPILPIMIGGFVGLFAAKYSYPDKFNAISDRVFYGLVGGLCSGFVYRLFKSILKANTNANLSDSDDLDLIKKVSQTINQNPNQDKN